MNAIRIPNLRGWLLSASLLVAGLGLTLQSCSPKCDPASIAAASNLKTALPSLLEKAATKKFNQEDADKVLKPLAEAVTRAQSTARNKDSAEQWRLLQDDIVKPAFEMWKTKGKLDADYVKVTKGQIERSLASIERAEKSKRGGCSKADMPATNN